jgi:hypothetical protein
MQCMSKWDVESSVTDMAGRFTCVPSFNDDISKWDASGMQTLRISVLWFASVQ